LQRKTKYGFLQKDKFSNFFTMFKYKCIVEDCELFYNKIEIKDWLQCFSVNFSCQNHHQCSWQTAELEFDKSISKIVGFMYHGALSCGLSYIQLQEFSAILGLKVPRHKHLFGFQRGYGRKIGWMDAVQSVWQERQSELPHNTVEQGSGIIVYDDARYNSSRFSYHGNAWCIEEIAIEEGLTNLLSTGVRIVEVVHDDKGAIDTILARLEIAFQKDLWHKAKKLMAKFIKELCIKRIQYTQSMEQCSCEFNLTQLTNATLQNWGLPVLGVESRLVARCIQISGIWT
jgi:hypothetical protein